MNWPSLLHTYWRTPEAPGGLHLHTEVPLLELSGQVPFHNSVPREHKIPNLPPHCTQRNSQVTLSKIDLWSCKIEQFFK